MSKDTDSKHERGPGMPTSLESAMHVDGDGKTVYSPAQKEAIARLKGQSPPQEQTESPNFTTHESPALREPERIEDVVVEESADANQADTTLVPSQ